MDSDVFFLRQRLFRFHVRRLVRRAGGELSLADDIGDQILHDEQLRRGGPLADLFSQLIKDFIENPEKWIAIIQTLIKLFSEAK